MNLTLTFELGEDGYVVAWVAEHPGIMSQGRTLDEALVNICDAIRGHLASGPPFKLFARHGVRA